MATVTVYNMENNQKYSGVVTTGNTLADLKAALSANGINYEGKAFMEASTSSTLNNDASTFPDDAKIFLTVSDKKVSSGAMSRQEAYCYVKSLFLGEAIKVKFGKNFTNVPTADLVKFVEANLKKGAAKSETKPAPVKGTASSIENVVAESVGNASAACVQSAEEWIAAGLSNGYITEAQAKWLQNGVKVSTMTVEEKAMFSRIK